MMQSTSVTLLLLLGLGTIQHAESAISQWTLDGVEATAGATVTIPKTVDENSPITYTLAAAGADTVTLAMPASTTDNDLFTFTPDTGVLELSSGLNFEQEPTRTVTITATDGNSDKGTATVSITVNNIPTAFTAPDTATKAISVTNGTAVGETVYELAANDATVYTIESGNTGTDFAIAADTGIITVANAIDKTRTASYALVVEAADPTHATATATLSITVTDRSSSATRVSAFTSLMSVFLILPFLHIL